MFNISGMAREETIARLISEYQLESFRYKRARELSGGYKRLLNIAFSVVNNPRIVLMDEPSAGLDVEMRKVINEVILGFKQKGISVILTTHYLEDVEQVADRLALVFKGKVVASGTLAELLLQKGGKYVFVLSQVKGDINILYSIATAFSCFDNIKVSGDKLVLVTSQDKIADAFYELTALFKARECRIGKVYLHEPSLNNVFMKSMR